VFTYLSVRTIIIHRFLHDYTNNRILFLSFFHHLAFLINLKKHNFFFHNSTLSKENTQRTFACLRLLRLNIFFPKGNVASDATTFPLYRNLRDTSVIIQCYWHRKKLQSGRHISGKGGRRQVPLPKLSKLVVGRWSIMSMNEALIRSSISLNRYSYTCELYMPTNTYTYAKYPRHPCGAFCSKRVFSNLSHTSLAPRHLLIYY